MALSSWVLSASSVGVRFGRSRGDAIRSGALWAMEFGIERAGSCGWAGSEVKIWWGSRREGLSQTLSQRSIGGSGRRRDERRLFCRWRQGKQLAAQSRKGLLSQKEFAGAGKSRGGSGTGDRSETQEARVERSRPTAREQGSRIKGHGLRAAKVRSYFGTTASDVRWLEWLESRRQT